ncbi:HPP family protein [Pseudomonas segetis]|uniref:CBS domain-containing membrane protein n=1 Tax=Pseudomonas segetis TaxID=298908 RepID=A0A239CV97_9PSED|nr:CBS domain-containing membrane protein [Pseudomonas segetis]
MWLRSFWPAPMAISKSQQAVSCLGAFCGLSFTAWFCHSVLGQASLWLIAPMGASAVLLFAVPSSPLAQPWSILGGCIVSALVGVSCARWLGHAGWVAGLAGGLAIGVMFALRCLHPPGGAVALSAVLAGEPVARLGYHFVVFPVAINAAMMLLIALLFNNLLKRRYPHRPADHHNPHKTADAVPRDRVGFTPDDLDAVLNARGELLDIARDDLEEILRQTEERAYRRRFGEIRCGDIMSTDVLSVSPQTPVSEAWTLLLEHRLNALPVVNQNRQLQGMLNLHDLLATADAHGECEHIMQRNVLTCKGEWPVSYLLESLGSSPEHRMPVLGEDKVLLGIVTQTDLVAALYRTALETRG